MIKRDEYVADDREVEQETPDGVLRLEAELVVAAHHAKRHEIRKD